MHHVNSLDFIFFFINFLLDCKKFITRFIWIFFDLFTTYERFRALRHLLKNTGISIRLLRQFISVSHYAIFFHFRAIMILKSCENTLLHWPNFRSSFFIKNKLFLNRLKLFVSLIICDYIFARILCKLTNCKSDFCWAVSGSDGNNVSNQQCECVMV